MFIKVGESEEDENMTKIAELQKEKDNKAANGVSNGSPQKFKVFKREGKKCTIFALNLIIDKYTLYTDSIIIYNSSYGY